MYTYFHVLTDSSPDVDVAPLLSQYRLVAGFKAKTVHPNDKEYADSLTFAMGMSLRRQYQQISAATIDYRISAAFRDASDNTVGSFSPPESWTQLSSALLDILMPSNSIEKCAPQLAPISEL